MKRLFLWLLCSALLLSLAGCGAAPDALPDAESAAPTETPAPTEDRTGLVNTDYSQYTPGGLPEAKYTRLSPGFIERLAPGDYGQLFPFAGEELKEAEWDYTIGRLYGLVDAGGRIVCDPVYSDVTRLSCTDRNTGETTYLPLWALTHYADPYVKYETEDYVWKDARRYAAVAALDGGWVTEPVFSEVTATPVGFIGWYDRENGVFDVFDVNGRRLFGSKELAGLLSGIQYPTVFWSEGTYLVGSDGWETASLYALDENGTVLFGPAALSPYYGFSEGLVCARSDNGLYGYRDRVGSWVIAPRFTEAGSFHDGVAACFDGENALLIDKNGEELLRIPGESAPTVCGGGYYSVPTNGTVHCYDAAGRKVEGASYPESGDAWQHVGGSIFFRYREPDAQLLDFATGKTYPLPEGAYMLTFAEFIALDGYANAEYLYYHGEPCFVACCRDDNGLYSRYLFIGRDLTLLGEERGVDVQFCHDLANPDVYLQVGSWETGRFELFRPDGRSLGIHGYILQICDGWVQETDRFSAKLYDPDGKLVFCYPLLLSLDD